MAHTICRNVTWRNSKLGGAIDGNGNFTIDDHLDGGNVEITGTHPGRGNASLLGRCNGNAISFALIDPGTNTMIGYLKGKYKTENGKDFIKGKFIKLDVTEADSAAVALLAADDWEADKTGA